VLTSILTEAQQSTSNYFGFQTEPIRANIMSPVSVNIMRRPDGGHYQTIAEIFGSQNEVGLKTGDPDLEEPDIVWLVNGDQWTQIYYNGGWRAVGHGDRDMSESAPLFNRGFYLQSRRDSDWWLVFAGYVNRDAMDYYIEPGLNLLNRGYPLDITLSKSGLASSPGFTWGDELTGDLVWLYKDGEVWNGEWEHYYVAEHTGRWQKVGGGKEDFGHKTIPSTFAINVRGKGGQIILTPPAILRRSKTVKKQYSPILPPPAPYIYTALRNGTDGSPYFFAMWYAYNFKVRYNTEVVITSVPRDNKWWATVHSQTSVSWLANPQLLNTYAGIAAGTTGVGRVTAEWDHSPIMPNKKKQFQKEPPNNKN